MAADICPGSGKAIDDGQQQQQQQPTRRPSHHGKTSRLVISASRANVVLQVAAESLQEAEDSESPALHQIGEEFVVLLRYAVPIIGTHLLENTLMMVSMIWVGELGTTEMAAMSLANMTLNCTSLSVIVGFASALEGMCSQAYTSGRRGACGSTLAAVRTMVILGMWMVPQTLFLWNIHPLFLRLHVHPPLAAMAAQALRILLFALPGYALFETSRRWLQAQAIISIPTIILLLVSPLNALLSYLLIVDGPLHLGFLGAPIATVFSFNLMGLSSLVYCVRIAARQGRPSWLDDGAGEIWTNLGPNFWAGLAGFVSLASEWWFWEFIGFAASYLGPSTLAAQSIIVTITTCASSSKRTVEEES